jgi:hypothetical protein
LKGKSIDRRAAAARRRRFLRQRPTDSSLTMYIRGYAKKTSYRNKKIDAQKSGCNFMRQINSKR